MSRVLPAVLLLCAACASPTLPNDPAGKMPALHEPALQTDAMRVGAHAIRVAVAADEASRGRGLGGRTSLAADEGMLFVYPSSEPRSFWMVDCLLDLDIAFLDEHGVVLNVVTLSAPAAGTRIENLPLARSAAPARHVLEVRAGTFAAWHIGPGTQCTLPERAR